jgi:nucleotide-binding universal stress UspA family protein
MYTRIVVPLDGSALAEWALPHAEALARVAGLPLRLIRVVDVVSRAGFAGVDYGYNDNLIVSARQSEEAAADEYLAGIQERYAARDIFVTTECRAGRVTQELLATARRGDLYVMASHGRGGISRWFLGSVAEAITRHSHVPVMVIRAPSLEHGPNGPVSRHAVRGGET